MLGVRLEPSCVIFPPTYISAISRFVVKIENTSDEIHRISFRNKGNEKEEEDDKISLDALDINQREQLAQPILFQTQIFSIQPPELDLYPHSFNQVIVEFRPLVAGKYEETAYIQIDAKPKRYKFELSGNSLPPVAFFKTDSIVVGHVNLDSVYEYEVELQNSGHVNVDFALEKKNTSCHYEFEPSSGLIHIGSSIKILVKFIASSVGTFMDTFTFRVKGATQSHPIITFSGKVIGPSFAISPRRIDFGGVGYGFLHTAKLELENKSEIPFDFKLRMSHDGTFERREFQILPESGTIPKYSKIETIIEFIPISTRNYNLSLYFDIDKYQEKLAEIPITANCLCPSLILTPEILDFRDIFIGHQYTKYVTLKNTTEYAAKFEFINQSPASTKLGIVEVIKDTGIVGAHDESKIGINFKGIHIGKLSIDCFFSIYGSNDPPIKLTIIANCTGPSLNISSQNITFGNVNILSKQEKTITIENNSLIEAKFQTFFDPVVKVFSVSPTEGIIAPKDSIAIVVGARVSDNLTFATNLKFQCEYLNTITLPVRANGTGTPIISSIDMENIDFGYILTETPATLRFTLSNHSDRNYEIRWSNQKPKFIKDQCDLTYTMEPDYAQILAHNIQEFKITLKCKKVTSFTMNLMCNSTVGRTRNEIYSPVLKASFIHPLINLSTNSIEFKQDCFPTGDNRDEIHPPIELLHQITKELTVTNQSKIPLNIEIDISEPFSCSRSRFTIEPSEAIELDIYFDTTFKTDFVSEVLTRKIQFIIEDHPQKVFATLKGIINFPNVSFSSKDPIDFGVAMMNTEQTKTIEMSNKFDSTIHYEWELRSEDDLAPKAFDIFPLRGDLEPGASIETHFGYFALADPDNKLQNYSATAVCHVYGGPDYQFPLKGSSASINYRIEPLNFELGERNYSEEICEKLTLFNTSNVPLKYSIQIPRRSRFKMFTVSPNSGTVNAKEEQEIEVRILPGLPQSYHESFTLQIGSFEDIQINVSVEAQFSQISLSLPRFEADTALQNITADISKKALLEKKQKIKIKQTEEEDDLDLDEQEVENEIPLERFLKEEKRILIDQLKGKNNLSFYMPSQQFYVAQYLFDFGEMILGEQRKESVLITNHANFPISFDANLDKLKRSGFKIEPLSYKDIQAHSSVNLDIIFNPMIRRNNELGPVCYQVPFTFNDNHQILLVIKASLKIPDLTFSNFHFEFGNVVIGQTKIMTLQLQNMNNVGCEFKFGPAEVVNILQKNTQTPNPDVFTVVPESGVLPPSSYMNIGIHFLPDVDKPFQMQFPLMLKHALTPSYITVDGRGVLLQLSFEPSELFLSPVQPFSSPSFDEVTVTNPTDYPIEFYSLQFDKRLFDEENNDPRQTESPFVTYTPKAKTPVAASKFSVCIIVTGPPLSGKSTVSKHLSQQFNLPIVNLTDVWKGTTEYQSILYTALCQTEYRHGFIIDGLPYCDETTAKDNETILTQCVKAKNFNEEISKTIPPVIAHQLPTSIEKALDFVLSSLDGHYVFHVSLRSSIETSTKRNEARERRQRGLKRHQLREEKIKLFNMTEDEYENLSKEEQKKIDDKRRQWREKQLDNPEEATTTHKKEKRSHSKSKDSKVEQDKAPQTLYSAKGEPAKRKQTKSTVPTDPIEQELLLYFISLGTIVHKLQSPTDRFKALDPLEIINFDKNEIIHSMNNVFVNADCELENVISKVMSFLPQITTLKESAFKLLIPDPITQDQANLVESLKQPKFFSIVNEDPTTKLTPRWKLQPKSQMTLKIQFDPFMPENVHDELLFAISSSNSPPISLKVNGECFYPQIERSPKVLYPSVMRKFDPKHAPLFVTETNEYNFGYVLICKERKPKEPWTYHALLNLENITIFPCEVSVSFPDPNSKNTWGVENPTFLIPPAPSKTERSKYDLSIGFHPTTANLFKTQLILSIKDNPDPIYVNLVGESFTPSIDISSLNIDFEKILINTEKSKKIELKNPGKLPVFWRLKGAGSLAGQVTFNQTEGMLQPRGTFNIVLKFQVNKPQQIKKTIQIEVLDDEKTRIFRNENINISAEAFDVSFDINVPKVGNEQLDFGQLKVGQSKSLQITVKNRGKYPVEYKFSLIDKRSAKYLTLSPVEGVAPINDKGTTINITFKANAVVSFHNNKAIGLKVIDTQTNTVTIQQTFTFCAKTFYNTFTITSGKKIDFGVCQVGNLQKKEFTITNTGVFPFEIEFIPKSSQEEEIKTAKGGKPKAPPPKAKPKPKQANALAFGVFSVMPNSALLQPNASTNFTLEFMSNEVGNYKEMLCVSIPDTSQADSNYIIRCLGNAYMPTLDIKDNEKIFPKLPLVIRADLLKNDITSFLEDEHIVHFIPRIINQQESITICLSNPQPIDCVVDLSIKSKGKSNAFDVKDKTLAIKAMTSANTTIVFSPPGSDTYSASFEATVKSQSASPALRFGLEGIGSIPTITLKTPLDKAKNGFTLNLGKTLLGYDKQKMIAIGNDTPLRAMVSISTKATPDFEIDGFESAKPFPLEPGHQFQFTVIHKPQKSRKSQFDLTLSVVENPKSNISISCVGEGFSEDLVFEGLEGEDSELHFKDAVVGRTQTVMYLMKNVSDSAIRFAWNASNDITFSPRVGHIKRNQTKEITAVFYSEKPTKYNGAKGSCQITKIELVDQNGGDWDDSMKVVSFVPRSEVMADSPRVSSRSNQPSSDKKLMKVTTVVAEPPYHPISSGKPRELPIKIFVVSDNIKCTIDTTEIAFAPTMMFQTRTSEVKLTNTCQIRMEYSWVVEKFESLRTDYSAVRPSPFSIEPSTGFIEAGQSTTFHVMFSPMEVDDFLCTLKCNVPYMNSCDPPRINVNGLSRRPLCHFNVTISDYLSRRHPDFTYQLPENVKVIELFSKALKVKSIKKIEIINPTSAPYDTKWSLLNDNASGSINIENSQALISSGKHYFFQFTFLPTSAKLVESLWEFNIPEHGVKIPFLFVGRISH